MNDLIPGGIKRRAYSKKAILEEPESQSSEITA